MSVGRGLATGLMSAGLIVLSCSADRAREAAEASGVEGASLPDSQEAAARIAEVRARFCLSVRGAKDEGAGRAHPARTGAGGRAERVAPAVRSALEAAVATGFQPAPGYGATTHVRAVMPTAALRGVPRPARVALPVRAAGEVEIEDETSHFSLRVALEQARDARIEVAGGIALYRGALDGADVLHRVHAEGTEDFVFFETRPAREELRYSVDVSRVAGLRLVSNTLEFLDETGTPMLRVSPPYVADARGTRHEAKLAVIGCGYDSAPAGPWGRRVTKPGAQRCSLRVGWAGDVGYPALVDPAWTSTGSMATTRTGHTASVLPSGWVLVAGGDASGSAELYDPAGNVGAGTFAATGSMSAVRLGAAASVLSSGKVLVVGGQNATDALGTAEVYDAGVGTFSATGVMKRRRSEPTASVLPSGKVLVVGGMSPLLQTWSPENTAELYDPAGNAGAGSFGATVVITTAFRADHAASVLPSGKVLVVGGYYGGTGTSAELFDQAGNGGAGSFAATGSMAVARESPTASVLASGKVLVVGGVGAAAGVSAELFDPAANGGAGRFVATGSMAAARYSHTASVLLTGKVLVAGGGDPSAELFDPFGNAGAGAFAAADLMAVPRRWHTASVLPSGKVLVTGGTHVTGGWKLANAELFNGCWAHSDCLSGFCADGVCCDSTCSGACDRCDVPGKNGTCSPAPAGDPGANAPCAYPLACDGVSGACPTSCTSDAACAPAYYCAPDGTCLPRRALGTTCNTQLNCKVPGCRECTSGFCVDGVCCHAACSGGLCESCAAALKQSGDANGTCGPTKDGIDPHNDCAATGGPCGADGMCNGTGACRIATPAGVSCGAGACQGSFAGGWLCNGAGACIASPGGVECAPFGCLNGGCTTNCTTSADCAANGWCNAGKCAKRRTNGKACATKEECTSNECADGFCCNAACTGQCEACDIAGAEGSCAPLSDKPHGARPACATGSAASPCSASQCDGTERATCAGFVGPQVACGQPSCTNGTETRASTCTGLGTCAEALTVPCGSYVCGATACKTSCALDEDCVSGSTCDAKTAKCFSGGTCDGDHKTTEPSGPVHDCAPYKCESTGACRSSCSSVNDCVAPTVCDLTGKCVTKPAVAGSDESGCSLVRARAGTARRPIGWLALAAALALVRRRRRR